MEVGGQHYTLATLTPQKQNYQQTL